MDLERKGRIMPQEKGTEAGLRQGSTSKCRSTVIIPNYNGIRYIGNCLTSLEGEPARILVVDNGSTDGSRELVQEKFPGVQVIALDKNYGFCYAVNRGMETSKTTYVILLNNDTVVEPGFVRGLEAAMDRDGRAFSGAAKMVNMRHPGTVDDAGDYYCALGWAFAAGKDRPAANYGKPREIFSTCGGACIYRRKVLLKIGMLDEKHFAYLEDVDLGYRAKLSGYRNLYVPEAVVRHAGSASSGSRYNAFKAELTARNSVYLVYKNMPPAQILLNLPFLVPGFLAKQIFYGKKGLGRSWWKGMMRGFQLCCSQEGRASRVRFTARRLPAYVRIQWELWRNICYRIW